MFGGPGELSAKCHGLCQYASSPRPSGSAFLPGGAPGLRVRNFLEGMQSPAHPRPLALHHLAL